MRDNSQKSGGQQRFALIDLLRYFAAMMVAIMHWGLELGPERMEVVYDLPVLGFLIKNGGLGVDIFFLISGYVILETAMRRDSLDFLIARFIRLFPGLLVSMSTVLVVGSFIIGSYEFSLISYFHSIFLSYQAANVQPLATQLWTLIFEIKFYGGVALILLVFPRVFKSIKGVVFLIAIWQILITLIPNFYKSLSANHLEFMSLGKSGILFAIGICLNLLSRNFKEKSFSTMWTYLLTAYFVFMVYKDRLYGTSAAFLLAVSAILILTARHVAINIKISKIFKYAGLSSYLIYLLHVHLGMAFVMFFQAHFTRNLFVLFFASALFISTCSLAIALLIEKPMQDYLKSKSKLIRKRNQELDSF
jgi:peptidoglycan/LPS O-acetylase OafA/YrhL